MHQLIRVLRVAVLIAGTLTVQATPAGAHYPAECKDAGKKAFEADNAYLEAWKNAEKAEDEAGRIAKPFALPDGRFPNNVVIKSYKLRLAAYGPLIEAFKIQRDSVGVLINCIRNN